jgi:hypothetical protein
MFAAAVVGTEAIAISYFILKSMYNQNGISSLVAMLLQREQFGSKTST